MPPTWPPPRNLAKEVGIDTANGASIMLATANGIKDGKLVTVDRVNVQGVDVAVVDDLPPKIDGLLGMSFLSRFELDIDHGQGQMTLAPRTSGQ
ncbi:MAG: TIGR02281 family clan AA aspartic protease [Bradymonadaceae bacterium]